MESLDAEYGCAGGYHGAQGCCRRCTCDFSLNNACPVHGMWREYRPMPDADPVRTLAARWREQSKVLPALATSRAQGRCASELEAALAQRETDRDARWQALKDYLDEMAASARTLKDLDFPAGELAALNRTLAKMRELEQS
jgi:hypothetical protein